MGNLSATSHGACMIIPAPALIRWRPGVTVPRGTPGELRTRGYSVMLGYWEPPDKTAEAVDAAHWMHTGDLAVLDEDGYLAVTGRIKDMVIRGGENVYPRAFCSGQLAHYKIPRYVHIADEFPMTVTGKVRKVEMRERSVEILGLGD
jgi:fatty-acyl-CoA synthase